MDDGSGITAVDELKWDGAGMGLGLQMVLEKEGKVQEVSGGAGVDESRHRDGKLAREEDVYGKGQVARGGEGGDLREGEGVLGPLPLVTSATLVRVPIL